MRAFVILCCIATAYSASLGYDYERNNGGGQDSGAVGGGLISGTFAGLDGFGSGGIDNSAFDAQRGSGGFGGNGVTSNNGQNAAVGPTEFTKEFFTYSAPEEEFNGSDANDQVSNSVKQSLRVIFIKGPENSGLQNAALQLAKSSSQDRTAIYVLSKQADVSDLANKLNAISNENTNKPEVHFVKYRTQADAENAQRTIQAQYDSLGGQSNNFDGGVAPVLNFASKAPVATVSHNGGGSTSGGSIGGSFGGLLAGGVGGNGYLPPNKRY